CMIGHPGLLELLPGRSAVDEMRSIDGRDFTELLAGVESLSDACRTFYRRFDLAIVWVDDHDGRIRQSLQSLDISRVTVQSPELRKLGKESAAERLKGTLSELEGVEFGVGPSLRMTESDKAEGAAWLVRHGISPDASQVVAVHPGSGSPSKCWPAERYAEVITRLLGDEIQIALIGGPADREVIARVEQHLGRRLSGVLESRCRVECHSMSAGVVRETVLSTLREALNDAKAKRELNLTIDPPLILDVPKKESWGDLATTLAMNLSSSERRAPMEIAQIITKCLLPAHGDVLERADVAPPGFINLTVKRNLWFRVLTEIEAHASEYGSSSLGN